jgi:hypothetical protein
MILNMSNLKGYQVRLASDQKDEIRALYLGGTPYQKIIKQFKCSPSSFWNVVRGLQLQVRDEKFQQGVVQMQALADAQKGWIAGIVDGEGYVGLVENATPNRATSLTPRIDVHSATRCMQLELRRLTGIGYIGRKQRPENQRDVFGWSLWAVETVGPFLEVITPYLIVKRRVAHVVLEFCSRRRALRGQPYDARDWHALKRVRELNKRGRS